MHKNITEVNTDRKEKVDELMNKICGACDHLHASRGVDDDTIDIIEKAAIELCHMILDE